MGESAKRYPAPIEDLPKRGGELRIPQKSRSPRRRIAARPEKPNTVGGGDYSRDGRIDGSWHSESQEVFMESWCCLHVWGHDLGVFSQI